MDINKVNEEINKGFQKFVTGTNKVVESTKLTFTLSEAEGKLNDAYTALGKKIYDNGTECDITGEIDEISILKSNVEQIKNQLLEVKNKKRCENCGGEISKDDAFCKTCGAKLDF